MWSILSAARTGGHVKDPKVVLRQKEMALARVRREVEALNHLTSLLPGQFDREHKYLQEHAHVTGEIANKALD